jgi:hypothetical protein
MQNIPKTKQEFKDWIAADPTHGLAWDEVFAGPEGRTIDDYFDQYITNDEPESSIAENLWQDLHNYPPKTHV